MGKKCGFCGAALNADGTAHLPPWGEHEEAIVVVDDDGEAPAASAPLRVEGIGGQFTEALDMIIDELGGVEVADTPEVRDALGTALDALIHSRCEHSGSDLVRALLDGRAVVVV